MMRTGENAAPDRLRVVSMNLFGRRVEWDRRRPVIAAGLADLRPDLVAFQETIKSDHVDQAAEVLGAEYQLVHQTNRDAADDTGDVEAGQGFSIASRWPLGQIRELDLHLTPRTAEFACGLLTVEVQVPGPIGPVLFAFHNPSWKLNMAYERELQAVAAAGFIEAQLEERPMHVVLAGDLDADPTAASTRFWTGRQSLNGMSVCYRDAWESAHPDDPGHTFTPDNPLMNSWDWPFRRIDYLFVRCGVHGGPTLAIDKCERIFDQPVDGVWASDHYGLLADLVLPTGR